MAALQEIDLNPAALMDDNVFTVKPATGRSVLVVEDDPSIQFRLTALLESAGYSVTCVSSVQEARAAAAMVFYPIVVVDRTLADGDGITLCSELRTGGRRNRVFVIVLSARDSQLDIGQGLRAGADAYLSKRTSDAELLAYLDAASAVAEFAMRFSEHIPES